MAVAAGIGCTLVVTEDGNLCSFGDNEMGHLDVGDFHAHGEPFILNYIDAFDGHEVVMVACGGTFCACVTKDGSLWKWGIAMGWMLDDSDDEEDDDVAPNRCTPKKVCMSRHGNSPVVMVACGNGFMLILTAAGRIWSHGSGGEFELGHGNNEPCSEPTCIDPARFDGAEIAMISAAGSHCMAVSKTDGRVWTWGCNVSGQTGVGKPDFNVQIPTLIPPADLDGGVVAFVSCGYNFSMLVTVDGVLWSCGCNLFNEIGLGEDIAQSNIFRRIGGDEYFGAGGVRMVSCGSTHSVILAQNRSVWCCGSNEDGELAKPFLSSAVPFLVDRGHFYNVNSELSSDNDVMVVAAGRRFSVAITSGGLVYTWGRHHDPPLRPTGRVVQERPIDTHGLIHMLAEGALGFAGNTTDYARAGRWHEANRARTIAFAMGTHEHFANDAATGGATAYSADFPEELLQDMFHRMCFAVREGSGDGVQSMLGVGTARRPPP